MHDKAEILAVDDTPANLRVIADTLSPAGYIVAAVTSGERALKRLQTYIPDLILLDIQMPGMNGFETCRQIKENPKTASIPIIFVTALSDDDSISKGFALGAVDYITKPFREAEILARVKTHLQLRNLTANLEKQVEQRTADLTRALKELQSSQMQLVQQEKMATLGNLVAGVAHEINNPVGFISGNLDYANEYIENLAELLELYQQGFAYDSETIQEKIEEIELDYLLEDFRELIFSMKEGTNRIVDISKSMRTFSRADTTAKVAFNIHEGINSTLLILKHRLKANESRPEIEIVKNYGELSEVNCYPGQLNQVFMNLIANAIDAFDENNVGRTFDEIKAAPNRIAITTEVDEEKQLAIVKIRDNGIGMSKEVKEKVFEHLFTTKEVGKGTGLGLSISREIVEEKHGGKITLTSEVSQGTEFAIALPLT